MRGAAGVALVLAVAALAAGCEPSDDPARFYTLGQIRDAAKAGSDLSGLSPGDFVTLRGAPISWQSPPYNQVATDQRPDLDGSLIRPSFCQGAPAANVTTEIWYQYAPIWWQPMYWLVTEYDPSHPYQHVLAGSLPIFTVGPSSSFYSPYWQVFFVVVPTGTDPTSITSNEQVLDGNYPQVYGPGRITSIVPDDIFLSQSENGPLVRPLDDLPVGPVKQITGYLDGKVVNALDFGDNRVTADSTGQVIETPLFEFVAQTITSNTDPNPGDDGQVGTSSLGLPTVAGVGPLFSGQVGPAPNNVPQFGALWRIYEVTLPGSAGVFTLPSDAALAQQLMSEGLQVPPVAPAIAALPNAADYRMRVALKPACFADVTQFPQGCQFLDSQAAVEGLISPTSIVETPYTLNCELVELNGQPIPNP